MDKEEDFRSLRLVVVILCMIYWLLLAFLSPVSVLDSEEVQAEMECRLDKWFRYHDWSMKSCISDKQKLTWRQICIMALIPVYQRKKSPSYLFPDEVIVSCKNPRSQMLNMVEFESKRTCVWCLCTLELANIEKRDLTAIAEINIIKSKYSVSLPLTIPYTLSVFDVT